MGGGRGARRGVLQRQRGGARDGGHDAHGHQHFQKGETFLVAARGAVSEMVH